MRNRFRLLLLITLLALPASWVAAQDTAVQSPTITVFCEDDGWLDQYPADFAGTIYQVLRPNETRMGYQLRWTNQTDSGTVDIPVPADLNRKITYGDVSPDGRYVALPPLEKDIPLVIWEIGTDELATLQLPDSDIFYLMDDPRPERRQVQKLDWLDNQHMVIRYFDLDYPWLDYQIAEKYLTVTDQPFEIIEGQYRELSFPAFEAPNGNTDAAKLFSPQRHYISVFSQKLNQDLTIGAQIQIYDAKTLELKADFTSQPNRMLNASLWTPDESSLFLAYRLPDSTVIGKTELTESIPNQQFQENRHLFDALESFFGSGIMFSDTALGWAISPSGNILALHLYEPQQNQYYVVTYTRNTGEIQAICDIGYPSSEISYPVWSPDERYFGYWNDPIQLFDLTNGRRYEIDGEGFVGWVWRDE